VENTQNCKYHIRGYFVLESHWDTCNPHKKPKGTQWYRSECLWDMCPAGSARVNRKTIFTFNNIVAILKLLTLLKMYKNNVSFFYML